MASSMSKTPTHEKEAHPLRRNRGRWRLTVTRVFALGSRYLTDMLLVTVLTTNACSVRVSGSHIKRATS